MECNRDEAIRAKEIAEKKLAANDIMGAKKFAQKAQNLYPGLGDVPQMLTILDVYVAAENKVDGETDWYGILAVDPLADEEIVRKQYRKLALLLHPDKNKSAGAEGAFKLISEAWIFLSDKEKKQAYDQKRRTKGSTAGAANGFYNIAKSASSNVKTKKNSTRAGCSTAPSSQKQKQNTFWTVCKRCKVQYEYLRVYLNQNLMCPTCNKPFLATEKPPPRTSSRASTTWNFSYQNQNSQSSSKFASNTQRDQWSPFSKTSGPSNVAQAATIVQQTYEQVKREREEAQAALKREEGMQKKRHYSKRTAGDSSSIHSNVAKRRRGLDEVQGYRSARISKTSGISGNDGADFAEFNTGTCGTDRVNGTVKSSYMGDLSCLSLENALKEKARMEIRKKLIDCSSASMTGTAAEEELKRCEKADEELTAGIDGDSYAEHKLGKSLDTDNGVCCPTFPDNLDAHVYAETLDDLLITVAESDFHDFDKDRTESCFQENQIWATYDNYDGMPRHYAMIHKVISSSPFKVQFSWLKPEMNSELGSWNQLGSGFLKTCGEFRVQKNKITGSLTSFSHKVQCTKGGGGVIQIFPRIGEVWAIYRNWSPDWNELTADELIHRYDVVEILEDFREGHGVAVVPLIKVTGFKTVFRRHLNPREVRSIPRAKMFRFSHKVPSNFIVDQEAPSALRGCIELDPAATPLELQQVVVDVKEAEVEEFIKEEIIIDSEVKDADMNNLEKYEKSGFEQKTELRNNTEVKTVEDFELGKTAL